MQQETAQQAVEIAQVYVWLLTGILSFIITIVIIIGTKIASNLGHKLDKIIETLGRLSDSNTTQTEQIKTINTSIVQIWKRIDEHECRIRNLEISQK